MFFVKIIINSGKDLKWPLLLNVNIKESLVFIMFHGIGFAAVDLSPKIFKLSEKHFDWVSILFKWCCFGVEIKNLVSEIDADVGD